MDTQTGGAAVKPNTSELLPLSEYDVVVVAYSGGKDSLACVLHLLEQGVPKDKLELWHHNIDGAPGSESFMDWPVTEQYVRATGEALGLRVRFSWREGGFLREMLRENSLTAPTTFELSDGSRMTVGGKTGKLATRRRFPQVSADLSVRWCSAYLKVDVCKRAMSNDPALEGKKVLLVTGERRQESKNRSRYAAVERHGSTNSTRRVDQYRAVLDWSEEQVWDIIKRWNVQPHPAYRLGWGRVSCMACIFGNPDQWASVKEMAPATFNRIAAYEREFNSTIDRKETVEQQAARGTSMVTDKPAAVKAEATGHTFTAAQFFLPAGQAWELPQGAYRACGGPS